jgi:hypothetical protein
VRVTPECDTLNSFVICDSSGIQTGASTVFNGENYIVVWLDQRFAADSFYVVTARVTPQGEVFDSGVRLGYASKYEGYHTDIAFDGERCLAVWNHCEYSTPLGVFGRFINSSTQPEGNVITIATTSTHYSVDPKVAFDGNNYLVVFGDIPGSFNHIYGQLVSPDGNLIGDKITIANSNYICQYYPDVVWDDHLYTVVWCEDDCIRGQHLDTNGQLIGSSFPISNTTSNSRDYPSIAVSNNNYLVAWQEQRSTLDIYGNVDHIIGVKETEKITQMPVVDALCHISPNPFRKSTVISYSSLVINDQLPVTNDLQCPALRIYDVSGRMVKSFNLTSNILSLASAVSWDGTDQLNRPVPAGVYFVRLTTPWQTYTEKVIY